MKAQELATGEIQKELAFCLSSSVLKDDDKIQRIKGIYDQLNVKQKTTDEMMLFYQAALTHLDTVDVPPASKQVFEQFAANLMERDR